MKKTIFNIAVIAALTVLASCGGPRYVAYRPAPVTVVRPVAPYAGAVWIGPEYRYYNRRYVAVPGYWARPRPHYQYSPGYWRGGPRGHQWVSGRWHR